MSYDGDVMSAIAEELYEFHVQAVHGPEGLGCLRLLIKTIRRMYTLRSPESFPGGLVVFVPLAPGDQLLDPAQALTTVCLKDAAQLPLGAVLGIGDDDSLTAWPLTAATAAELADRSIVYRFPTEPEREAGDVEQIVLPDGPRTVRNPVGYPSVLAPPTFWNLEDALTDYANKLAAKSTCKILKTAWAQDATNRRLVLANKPESRMRESLAQHLRSSLRDVQLVRVNEEQMMSETEPVDIEVTWSLTSHIAIIEVKWLGRCLNADGTDLANYTFTDGRARDGAKQLANYLDEFEERVPGHEVKGYLVCFDARRQGITSWEPGDITAAQAWNYSGVEIVWNDSIPVRGDFRPPRRIFLEPRVPQPVQVA